MTRHTAPRPDTLERLRRDPGELQRRQIRPAPSAPADPTFDVAFGSRDHGMLAAAAVVWWALLLGAAAIAPEAADPDRVTFLSQIAEIAQVAAILAVALTVATGGRRAAGGAMLVGGAVFLGSAVACVATAHHAFGPWWYGQAGATVGMMGVGAALLLRRRRGR